MQTITNTITNTACAPTRSVALTQLALFDVTGADATSFLQGQLTQDVLHWQPHQVKRAAWCNVKGRMLVTFYLWQIEDGFRLIMAQDLVAKVLPRLRMFVMRAKVVVSEPLAMPLYVLDESVHFKQMPMATDGVRINLLESGFGVTTAIEHSRQAASTDTTVLTDWTLAHTHAGVAWISVANSEQFVPQTSNFELVGGVNFRKGCYPGQEIVARSQYLGKLKQRAAIAQVAGEATALEDVFQQGDSNPVGRVIQSTIQSAQGGINSTVLFEAPHSLIENQTTLTVGSATGAVLQVKPLPYPVVDITA